MVLLGEFTPLVAPEVCPHIGYRWLNRKTTTPPEGRTTGWSRWDPSEADVV